MSEEDRDPVDEFFDSIGAEPADPKRDGALDAARGRGTRDRVPLVAAALVVVAIVLGAVLVSTRPSEGILAVSPSITRPSPRTPLASPTETPAVTARVTPLPHPTAAPTPGPPVLATWDLIEPLIDVRTLRLRVSDQSGDLLDARVAVEPPGGTRQREGLGPLDLDIRQSPGDPAAIWVGWAVVVCEHRAELVVAPGARLLTLQFAPSPGCDLGPVAQGVVLTFDRPVDASAMSGTEIGAGLLAVGDLRPTTIAFADALHGWIGGTTAAGDAMVVKTDDGGVSWRISGMGEGRAVDLAAIDATHALGSRACNEVAFNCRPDHPFDWHDDFGGFGGAAGDQLVRIDFQRGFGAGVARIPDRPPQLQLAIDGGTQGWTPLDDPCAGAAPLLLDAERLGPEDLVVLCVGESTSGGQSKAIVRTTNLGRTWVPLASTERTTLPRAGQATDIDLIADGSGWLWGFESQVMVTTDFGATWDERPAIDSDATIAIHDATWLGGGTGMVLVEDPADGLSRLLGTADGGFTWTEVATWPLG